MKCPDCGEHLGRDEENFKLKEMINRFHKYFAAHVMIPNKEYQEMCVERLNRKKITDEPLTQELDLNYE